MSLIIDIIHDFFPAAVAAIGFGAVSDPSPRSLLPIGLLGGTGHLARYLLMTFLDADIVTATLGGSLLIGFLTLLLAARVHQPLSCLYIPALLPMVPGKYAYKSVYSLILFVQSTHSSDEHFRYMMAFMSNATITFMVIAMLAAGATLPYFLYRDRSFSMTRQRHPKKQ